MQFSVLSSKYLYWVPIKIRIIGSKGGYPRSGYKNCPRRGGGGRKMAKFYPRSCWLTSMPIMINFMLGTIQVLRHQGGGWGQKMAIFDDLQDCKSSKRWVGLKNSKTWWRNTWMVPYVINVHTSKCRRSFINGDLTGHVRDGHLVGLYLHSLSSCSSILGSWNGQPETLNLHLVLWPLNKELVSINLLIRWFHESCFHQSRIIFHQIYYLFWPPQNNAGVVKVRFVKPTHEKITCSSSKIKHMSLIFFGVHKY